MTKTTITSIAAFAAACLAGSSAFAGTRTVTPKPSKPVAETISESCITGDIGIEAVSEYVFHGIPQENQGAILQPYADLHLRLYKGTGLLSSVTADIGIWNSFHDRRTNASAGSQVGNWYEFDFTAGITASVDKFSISPYFRTYESPSGAYRTAYTLGLNVGYDDTALLGDFALHPHALFERGMSGTSGSGTGNGNYWELGIAPGHAFGPVTLTVPINVGLGSAQYYIADRTFGFFSAGVNLAYGLDFVPSCLGKWTTDVGFTYYRVGRGAQAAPDPDRNRYVFNGGLKVAF